MKLVSGKRLIEWVAVAVAVTAVALLAHFYIADRLGLLRAIYPLQAPLAKLRMSCSADAPEWLREVLAHAVDTQYSLANQVAYIEPRGTVHHCENGWRDMFPWSEPVSMNDRFRYASLTKLVTADAVLTAIAAAGARTDARLLDIFAGPNGGLDPRIKWITVEQLLNHSAGFDRLRSSDSITVRGEKPWCPYEIAKLADVRLDFTPGERYAYSNLGYCLLGAVVEQLSGKPYRQFVEDQYRLENRGIRFIEGPYLDDEVRYDFRNSTFYDAEYYRHFDFRALSSSLGLSGNAVALAELLHELIQRRSFNILSTSAISDCDAQPLNACFGFAGSPYGREGQELVLHIQGGLLFGAASKAVLDDKGGVTVWLGSGMAPRPSSASQAFAEYIYNLLATYYSASS